MSGPLPTAYTSWNALRVFELSSTNLTGTIPAAYFTAWLSLENFTIEGATIGGYLPSPVSCTNLTWYGVQSTPVVSDATQPLWVLTPAAAMLKKLVGLRLGECGASCQACFCGLPAALQAMQHGVCVCTHVCV